MRIFWIALYGFLAVSYVISLLTLLFTGRTPSHADIGFALGFSLLFFVDRLIENIKGE